MDAAELRDAIEDDYETELSRLGSSKALYAVTEGDMEAGAVLSAMADRAHTAAGTFAEWAADEADDDAAATFEAVADEEREHARRLADAGGDEPAEAPTPIDEHLRGLGSAPERAAGLVAWALVTDRTLSQAVGFFVGSADRKSADLFRDLRSDTDDQLDRALGLLDAVVSDDPEGAEAAAGETVEAAYAHYVEVLEGMGIKVKPVC